MVVNPEYIRNLAIVAIPAYLIGDGKWCLIIILAFLVITKIHELIAANW